MHSITPPIYSDRFSAVNVWEVDVPVAAVDRAATLFAGIREESVWQWQQRGTGDAAAAGFHRQFSTRDGAFFELRRQGWNSDISWVSCDDEKTHGHLREVFDAFNLQDTVLGGIIPGRSLRLFAAYYVVRSSCKDHNWHCDFDPKTFPALMTLITPLADYPETSSFQLSYMSHGPLLSSEADVEAALMRDGTKRRYEYKKGKAIVFGSGFLHSTEPGAAGEGRPPHAYLSFTFGSDDEGYWWPLIAPALLENDQSRIVARASGALIFTRIGREMAGQMHANAASAQRVRAAAAAETELEEFVSDALEIRQLSNRGRGVVVQRGVEMGELLMVSRALVVGPVETVVSELSEVLHQADNATRRAFLSLYHGATKDSKERDRDNASIDCFRRCKKRVQPEDGGLIDEKRVGRVLAFNAGDCLEFGDEEIGLWLLPALLNHDCAPTAVSLRLDKRTFAIVAAVNLEAGDEVTDTYVDLLQTWDARQQCLRQPWQVNCQCQRCSAEMAALPAEVISSLSQSVQKACDTSNVGEADLLSRLDRAQQSVSTALVEAPSSFAWRCMLHASLLLPKIVAAKVYESPHCSVQDRKGKCAELSWDICLSLEQFTPLSEMHLQFAELRYQHCERPAARREALHYLFVVWLLRFGSLEGYRAATYSGPLRETPPAERMRLFRCFSGKVRLCKTGAEELLEEVCSRGFGDLLDATGLLLRAESAMRNPISRLLIGGLNDMD